MADFAERFEILRQHVPPATADAVEQLLRHGSEPQVNRINPCAFADENGLPEAECIAAFLYATRAGLVDLEWNVICDGCGGLLQSGASLKSFDRDHYHCSFCATDCTPVLDDRVEVTFTASPFFRHIAAHDPAAMPMWDFIRQMCWSSATRLPDDMEAAVASIALDAVELPAGTAVERSFSMPEGTAILFDPVSNDAIRLRASGPASGDPQRFDLTFGDTDLRLGQEIDLSPGPVRLRLANLGDRRALPVVLLANDALMRMIGSRGRSLSAKRLLSHQTFRDLFRVDVLDTDQRFRITSLTILFTDLKGSTALYDRVGDLAAFDLIRSHFLVLTEIVARHSGALVKTIGDAVMASFPLPADGMAAALEMRRAMVALNERHGARDLLLKIGLHSGPCLAVTLNDRQDYFGQTVNIAARVQGLAEADRIVATAAVLSDPAALSLVEASGLQATQSSRLLRGLGEETVVYELA